MHGSFFGSDTTVIAARVEEVISDVTLTVCMILYTLKAIHGRKPYKETKFVFYIHQTLFNSQYS